MKHQIFHSLLPLNTGGLVRPLFGLNALQKRAVVVWMIKFNLRYAQKIS